MTTKISPAVGYRAHSPNKWNNSDISRPKWVSLSLVANKSIAAGVAAVTVTSASYIIVLTKFDIDTLHTGVLKSSTMPTYFKRSDINDVISAYFALSMSIVVL